MKYIKKWITLLMNISSLHRTTRNFYNKFDLESFVLTHLYLYARYLTEGQIIGDSSLEGYISALQTGCRCIELDIWDGPDDEPVVYHGYTLTSKLLVRDVLNVINKYAFVASEYPLILSTEIKCTEKQQALLAGLLQASFGGNTVNDRHLSF